MEMPNNIEYNCVICNFNCRKHSNWIAHIKTKKHCLSVNKNGNAEEINGNAEEIIKNAEYNCQHCGKIYVSQSGIWKHSKKCIIDKTLSGTNQFCNTRPTNKMTDKEIIMMLIKDNNEFKNNLFASLQENQKYMMDIIKNGTQNNNTINNNNNNCGNTNKTFNLQVFLNETCKDAINMSDFVDQLQVSISDLETTGKIGYAEGISKVFIKKLDEMNYTDRPIHCSDSKREILYIKENNLWSKDDEQKTNLTRAIKNIANKNIKQISEWQKQHPDFLNPNSKESDKYMKIVLNSMSGSTVEESDKNYEKIARNVIKKVVIEK